ncbi:MAG: DUF1513 domain-containing protein [Planctomycetes bacterium]|nr:DUF1513 domain-containing protein [Planctomycetota bacterium]
MNRSRREFLKKTGLAAAGLGAIALTGCGQNAAGNNAPANQPEKAPDKAPEKAPEKRAEVKYGTIIGPGKYEDEEKKTHNVLSIINLDAMTDKRLDVDARRPRLIELAFYAHGVSPHPLFPDKAVLFEKHGAGCCEVDLRKGEVTKTITTGEDRQFYGHGAFSRDGSEMYCTEVVISERKKGVIIVRDSKTYEIQGEFPSYGTSPHDCTLIDGGATLMITNGGDKFDTNNSPPCVTFVDVKTQKQIDKFEFDTARINAGHAAITSKREIAVVSAMRDGLPADSTGAVSFRIGKDAARTMTQPKEITSRMKGESLSVAIHEETGVVGVTNPEADLVTFWNLREGKFIKALELDEGGGKLVRPTGIALTLDNSFFAISFGTSRTMQLVSPQTLELVAGARIEKSFLSGSHFIVYAL